MSTLNETPSSNRLHIGIYGKTNSGKSSLINAFTSQDVSIVADVAGTTTDPVYKPMEINPLGACVIIDTAGFDDGSELGKSRVEKTHLAAEKTDIAVIVLDASCVYQSISKSKEGRSLKFGDVFTDEKKWIDEFKKRNTPVLVVLNKTDLIGDNTSLCMDWLCETLKPGVSKNAGSLELVMASAARKLGIEDIKAALTRLMPEGFGQEFILGDLVNAGDLVLLVMPQDIQAPKGRLILPQVQTLRELLDRKCIVMSVTTDKLTDALKVMSKPPRLIITDSQVFKYVYENKPVESMLTSFSVLFAAYKGDLPYYVESAKAIDKLTPHSKVLIAECCTHAPIAEDIGRVKLPGMLKKRIGDGLTVDIVSGTDFPQDLTEYDLIIQCGACMFNRKYVLSRIDRAHIQNIPMTNYGVAIAHITGILDNVSMPC